MAAAKTGKGNSPVVSLRCPGHVWQAAARTAEKRGESRNAAIVRFLEEYARDELHTEENGS